ncbi:hypothetical protein L211DRAFT_849338 [Terfezia boudieri ATCC MYA-4762]|uniref:Uncharacterized protein n=1 Tax=Terfezia boudieri ATCC MYA-4762 TaxID=1051890 RepID=A0A3N4LLC7_9PEZI|nr:hypothetical protein L211DRAFT_849338 [Terfezia boudieri ATCC MYA-4762]
MGLVQRRFEQGPEQDQIHEILCLVWIGWDILIAPDIPLQHSTPNPFWDEMKLDDYTLYDLLWIGMFGNFLKRYQGELADIGKCANSDMHNLCWGVCEIPTPCTVSSYYSPFNCLSSYLIRFIDIDPLSTNSSNGS